jgi:integrase/recombinase XerD
MFMTALFYTGMRPIELFGLHAESVDTKKRWIVLASSKTGEPRGIPIHEFLVPLFAALVKRGGILFRTPRGGPYPLTEDVGGQLKTAINGARRRSGIADVSPYTARHTVSTQLVINGVHSHIKDQILGHAVDDMTDIILTSRKNP